MRLPWFPVLLACAAVAACKPPPLPAPPSPSPAGWMRVSDANAKQITCGELPVLVDISHAEVILTGYCGYVRVIGEHLDVRVDLAPGGTIDLTGAHNDIYWRLARPGAPPNLINRAPTTAFIRRAGECRPHNFWSAAGDVVLAPGGGRPPGRAGDRQRRLCPRAAAR